MGFLFPKSGNFFFNPQQRAGKTPPVIPLVAPLTNKNIEFIILILIMIQILLKKVESLIIKRNKKGPNFDQNRGKVFFVFQLL